MARGYSNFGYSHTTVGELQAMAEKSAKKAQKAGQTLRPIAVTGRAIAKKWWGVAWCENLERYADYANRIDRGKRYVRAGAVIDLQIEGGWVRALVQGSRRAPYKVDIAIDPLSQARCGEIMAQCARKIENAEALLSGSFPEALQGLFTGKNGLFPTPREIHFGCSCPDWASMCKHVAAALYGVGARLDEAPALFFELRGIDFQRFIDAAVADRVQSMLQNADAPSPRIIADGDLTALFGVL